MSGEDYILIAVAMIRAALEDRDKDLADLWRDANQDLTVYALTQAAGEAVRTVAMLVGVPPAELLDRLVRSRILGDDDGEH